MAKDGSWYDEDYWERARESGKGGFTGPYTWERLQSYFKDTAKHIVKSFNPDTVLDVGCGKGYLVTALRYLGVKAYGMDFSEYAVKHCPDSVKDFIQVKDVTKGKPDFDIKKFSLVISTDVLEHIDESKINSVLKRITSLSTDYVILNIGLKYLEHNEMQDMDKSHCNVHFRPWWVEKIGINCPDFELLPEGTAFNGNAWWFNVSPSLFVLRRIV